MSIRSLIAVCQMCATENIEANFLVCKRLIEASSRAGAKFVFLPEGFDYIAKHGENSLKLSSSLDGDLISRYRTLAQQLNVWISLGGFHEKVSDDKMYNSHLIINNAGNIVGHYRKLHLFDVNIPSKNLNLMESNTIKKGENIVEPIFTPVGKLGLAICYDLRFPELSLTLKSLGAEILLFPSAFSFQTGANHWETLLRARAIENQVYVVAAAQIGLHSDKRHSWGHAMVVDPMGTVIAQCSETESFSLASINLDSIKTLSSEMPLMEHRRNDLFSIPPIIKSLKVEGNLYLFGQNQIPDSTVFYKSNLCFAFTNIRCILPGHVLIAPLRCVETVEDLIPAELADLFKVVQKVDVAVRKMYKSCSSTITIQNGEHAGQTIKHLHIHIIPRKPDDFEENDEIYDELYKHDKSDFPRRNLNDMIAEASSLRSILQDL